MLSQNKCDWNSYPKVKGNKKFYDDVKYYLNNRFNKIGDWLNPLDNYLLPVPGTREPLHMLGYCVRGTKPEPIALITNPFYHAWRAAGLMSGGSGDGAGGKSGEKNPLAKGISNATDFSGRIPRKINIPKRVVNQKIKPPKTKIKVPKEKIKAPKIKGKGVKTNIKPKIKPNVVKKPIPKIKPTTFKPQKIVLNKGLKGVGRNIIKKGGSVLAVADAAMTTVDRLQEGQTAKQAFVGGAAEATGSFLGFGKGFKIGAAITAKAAAPLIVAPIPGARILYGAAILTGGIASGFIGSKIGRSVSGGLADRFTGVQKKLETVKAEKRPMGRSYNKRKKKKTIVVPVNTPQNEINPTGGGSNIVNNSGQSMTGGGNGGGGTVIINSNNQEGMLLTKLDAN